MVNHVDTLAAALPANSVSPAAAPPPDVATPAATPPNLELSSP